MFEKFQLGGHSVFWPRFGNTFVNFWKKKSFFVGLLIPLFWTSGGIFPGFQMFSNVNISCPSTDFWIHH